MRELTPQSISIRKGGRSNSTSEVSETTKVCTDPSTGQSFYSMLSKPLYTRTAWFILSVVEGYLVLEAQPSVNSGGAVYSIIG